MKTENFDKEIEHAIQFLVFAIHKSGNNPKPVILHSIKVGLYLYEKGYPKNVVLAAILHDVLEDTATTLDELVKEFGEEIARLVQAGSFDSAIEDKMKQYKEMFKRTRKAGKDAMIVKAADVLENSYHWGKASDEEQVKWLLAKAQYFLETASELKGESVYDELQTRVEVLSRQNFTSHNSA